MKPIILFVFCCVCAFGRVAGQQYTTINTDSFQFQQDTSYRIDSLVMDSMSRAQWRHTTFGLLDSLENDSFLRSSMASYHLITNYYTEKPAPRLNLPTVKEIETRPARNFAWKFWIICFILLYISFVRISNPNNFRVFILSVFNLKLSERIWADQRPVFSFVILQLFAIYLFIAALFINYFLELNHFNPLNSYFVQYITIVSVLLIVYLVKFIIHGLLGVLFKMNKLGFGFVANTVSVNNFIALVILPFIIFIIYNENSLMTMILAKTVMAFFFISVGYRIFRIILLRHTFFSFPNVYLFLYLCTLEIVPWFVIVKFINQYSI